MASDSPCAPRQRGNNVSRESKSKKKIDHGECQNNLSCSLGSCIDQEFKENNDARCNTDTACSDNNHETFNMELQQNQRQLRRCTPEDFNLENHFDNSYAHDDDDDEDDDWEPINHLAVERWFCTNCTAPNSDLSRCYVCGECIRSDISGYDTFQSYISQVAPIAVDSDVLLNNHDVPIGLCTAIGFDERMLLHSEVGGKPTPHPERPDRLVAIAAGVASAEGFPAKCYRIPAREITREELQLVHSLDHIETVEYTSRLFSSYFTPDTYANGHSASAARIAAGFCADLARSLVIGRCRNGFALVRPPGHHAGIKQAMGFCLHNNAAVAALAAQSAGAKKVLIVDWDVHHGNGTQEIFDGNKSVLYISLHRHEGGMFYPGTGAADEVGISDAKGYSVNIPWSCGGVGDNDYIFAFQNIVLPIASGFSPDITIISAGFDAARGDPLGCCDVTPDGYAQMTHMLTSLSDGKVLVILEGGYNLRSISISAASVIKVLFSKNYKQEFSSKSPSKEGYQTVLQVLNIQMQFWPTLKSIYENLLFKWERLSLLKKNALKKRRFIGPVWWKWGSKRLAYERIFRCSKSAKEKLFIDA